MYAADVRRLIEQAQRDGLVPDGEPMLVSPLKSDAEYIAFQRAVDRETEAERYLSENMHTKYRSLLGTVAYLYHTHIHLLFLISFMGRFSAHPTRPAWDMLVDVARYAKSYKWWGVGFFRPSEPPRTNIASILAQSTIPECPSGGFLPLRPTHAYV